MSIIINVLLTHIVLQGGVFGNPGRWIALGSGDRATSFVQNPITLIAFVTMNHIQEETDGSRKCAASTESQRASGRTTGRCAPEDRYPIEGCSREERSRASPRRSSTG